MYPAVVTAVTHPVPLSWPHLYGSSQLSGSALSWPRTHFFELRPPSFNHNRAETPDVEGSVILITVVMVSRQSSQEYEGLPCPLHWEWGRAKRTLSYSRQQQPAALRAERRIQLGGQAAFMAMDAAGSVFVAWTGRCE